MVSLRYVEYVGGGDSACFPTGRRPVHGSLPGLGRRR
jgi:hypothetical protein